MTSRALIEFQDALADIRQDLKNLDAGELWLSRQLDLGSIIGALTRAVNKVDERVGQAQREERASERQAQEQARLANQ